MLKVNLYATLRSMAGQKTLAIDLPNGSSLKSVLDKMFEINPRLRSEILNEDGSVQEYVSIFIAGRDIRYLDGLDSAIEEGRNLDIFPPVAGG